MNSHSLFWKIFLYFWVSMMLFGIFSTLINAKIRQTERNSPYTPVSVIIKRSHQLIKQDTNKTVLREWLVESQDRIQSNTVYILDSKGKDLLNRPLNTRMQQALHEYSKEPQKFYSYLQNPDSIFFEARPQHSNDIPPLPGPAIIIIKLVSNSGESYTLIIDNKTNRNNWVFWRSVSIGTRIAMAFLLSGIICSFLARYLTIPLQKLRIATHRIASGHFDSSMNKKIAKRKDEIGDLGRDFDSMVKRIEITLQSQQRLLRDVSHELRSPLARLQIALGLAYQCTNGLIQPELQRIEKEVERLNDLISQSLSLARISSQASIPKKTKINLTELLKEVVETAKYEAQNKKCHIISTQMDNCFINGNKDLLYSGLENILRNAIQHTKIGTHVETSLILSNTYPPVATLTICDHGMGVPESDIDELFKPFFQVDEARTQQNEGYGIGLAIADRAIHLHNGSIRIANIAEGGLEVSIQLPVLTSTF
ncbi:MAG: ATP-binding protein [Methylococcaceae bacterium]|nr:ATP-binding protein [Methylococcaceae bacterium]